MSQVISLPLFPLTSHILPGGILPLRIFEARYLRMIKESYASEHAFGMCMLNSNGNEEDNSHIYPIGTLVKVTDFEKLDDGQLGITIEGIQPFKIESIVTEQDGLRVGSVELLNPWPESAVQPEQAYLIEKLQELYLNYPDLAALYQNPPWNNASWLAQRWLEILPLAPWQKQNLLQDSSVEACLNFLSSSIQK